MKALIISADNFEDSELLVPYYRLKEAGVEVAVASLSRGAIMGKHGYEVAVDKTLDEVNPDDYGILILPGGAAPAGNQTIFSRVVLDAARQRLFVMMVISRKPRADAAVAKTFFDTFQLAEAR